MQRPQSTTAVLADSDSQQSPQLNKEGDVSKECEDVHGLKQGANWISPKPFHEGCKQACGLPTTRSPFAVLLERVVVVRDALL